MENNFKNNSYNNLKEEISRIQSDNLAFYESQEQVLDLIADCFKLKKEDSRKSKVSFLLSYNLQINKDLIQFYIEAQKILSEYLPPIENSEDKFIELLSKGSELINENLNPDYNIYDQKCNQILPELQYILRSYLNN